MANEVRITNRFIDHANTGDTRATQIRASKRFVDALRVTGAWWQAKKSAAHEGTYAGIPVIALKTKKDKTLIVVSEKRKEVCTNE